MKAIGKALRGAVGIVLLTVFVWLAVRFLDTDPLRQAFPPGKVEPPNETCLRI